MSSADEDRESRCVCSAEGSWSHTKPKHLCPGGPDGATHFYLQFAVGKKNDSIPFDISHVAEIGSLSGAEQMEKRLPVGQMMYTATIGSSYAGRSSPIGSCNCNEDALQHTCPRYMAVV